MDSPAELAGLLAATALHDRRAFQQLYRLTAAKLYGIALRIVRIEALAEDCVQEAYVNIWQNAGEYRPGRGTPLTWMGSIVRYRALDRLRRDRHMESPEDDSETLDRLAADGPTIDEGLAGDQEAAALKACLALLRDAQKDCVHLAFFDGLSHEQIAARLDRPLGTVKTWIRRGLQSIKRCLER